MKFATCHMSGSPRGRLNVTDPTADKITALDRAATLRKLIADTAADVSAQNEVWTAGDLADALIATGKLVLIGPDAVEDVARAISTAKGINPDAIYQHHEGEDWPVDDRREYVDAFSGEKRVMLSHKAWRRSEKFATAALAALGVK